MSEFSGEALRKLNKDELIANILIAEVKKITSSCAKLESDCAISRNITTVLSGRLAQTERQC